MRLVSEPVEIKKTQFTCLGCGCVWEATIFDGSLTGDTTSTGDALARILACERCGAQTWIHMSKFK